MSDAKRHYLRIYHHDLQREYPEVWFDPTCLATWLRLLSLTDMAWPAPAILPRAVRRADLTMLTNLGLVTILDRDRFTMKGYEKERESRASKARDSVAHRYGRTTNVERTKNDRTSNELLRDAGASAPALSLAPVSEEGVQGEPDAWDAFAIRTGEVPGEKMRGWLNELSEAHGEARVVAMIEQLPKTQRNSVDYLKAVRDALRAADFEAEKAERAAEKARVTAKRAPVRPMPVANDISEAEAKRLAAEYLEQTKGGAA